MFRSKRTKNQHAKTSNRESSSFQRASLWNNSSQPFIMDPLSHPPISIPNNSTTSKTCSFITPTSLPSHVHTEPSMSFTQLLMSGLQHAPSSSTSTQHASTSSQATHNQFQSRQDEENNSNDDANGNEFKSLEEVELIDEDGNVLRTQKMTVKDVYLHMKANERILVHLNEHSQPIRTAGGLCTRFMTMLLEEPKLCAPDAKTFLEVKKFSGTRLLEELRAKFSFPCTERADKVMLAYFDNKFRSIKARLKKKLLEEAKTEIMDLRKANPAYVTGEEEFYTETHLLEGLDLVKPPQRFADHEWERFKKFLQSNEAKELSKKGKNARNSQIHIRTTGAKSLARERDEFKLKHKRDPYEVEFFEITYKSKNGSYVKPDSEAFMAAAKQSIAEKASQAAMTGPVDYKIRAEIKLAVMKNLMGEDMPGRSRGYGAGVTKSLLTPLNNDLRRMRNSNSYMHENHLLRAQVREKENEVKAMKLKVSELEEQQKFCFQLLAMSGVMTGNPDLEALFRKKFGDFFGSQISSSPNNNNDDEATSPYGPTFFEEE